MVAEVKKDDPPKPGPGLYLVATPIGNLGDITLRALDLLKGADVIACEDSRVTGKLLSAYGIATPMTPYHEYNAARARPRLMERMRAGSAVALVSDAGLPLVSDPGFKLVAACREDGIPVTALPGANAALTALQLAALPTDAFHYAGFLAPKSSARRRALGELAGVQATLIFYESARRLPNFIADAAEVLGPRPAAICRELTKLHEEVARGTLAELAARLAENGPPKGEVVVVIGPPKGAAESVVSDAEIDAALAGPMGTLSLRDAVDAAAAETGVARKRVYTRALALAGKDG